MVEVVQQKKLREKGEKAATPRVAKTPRLEIEAKLKL